MNQNRNTRRRGITGIALCGLCVSVVSLLGCRGERDDAPPHQFFPDMDDAPKWKPQVQTQFFPDGRSMRQQVEGTVAFSRWGYNTGALLGDPGAPDQPADRDEMAKVQGGILDRADLLQEDDAFYRGVTGTMPDGKPIFVKTIPIPVTPELIARGQERFNIYCSVCHGYNGNGNGMVGQRWTGNTVANFHDPKYTNPSEPDHKGDDGFFFFTAMNGVPGPEGYITPSDSEELKAQKLINNKMPPYRHALTERDAWAIVSYIRVLQQSVPLDQVPDAAAKQKLEAERAALPPEAPSGATGASGAPPATGAPAPSGAPASTAPKGQP